MKKILTDNNTIKTVFNFILKKSIISAAILLIGVVLGYFLLFFSFCIPISSAKEQKAVEEHSLEPYFPKASIMLEDDWLHKDKGPDILDYSTDELIIKRSLSSPDEPIFKFCVNYYPRYWGGYVTFFRPLFVFFELSEIRVIIFITQFFLALLLAYAINKKTGKIGLSLAWLSIYLLLLPNTLALNFQYCSSYCVAVISAIILTMCFDHLKDNCKYFYLFLVAGMCTAYFDFLTYPIFAWAISAVILITLMGGKKQSLSLIFHTMLSFIAWFGGYVVFWGSKWVISSLLTDQNVVLNALNQVKHQQGAEKMVLIDRFDALSSNWERLSFAPFLIIFLAWIVAFVVSCIKLSIKLDYRYFALMISMVVTLVWYVIIATQHVTDHSFFTWRNALSAIFAFFVIVCLNWSKDRKDKFVLKQCRNNNIKLGLSVLCCLLMAVLTYYVVPAEKTGTNNYMDVDIERVIPERTENAYSYSFIPSNSIVTEIDSLLRSDDQSGYYELSVFDGEKRLYTAKVDSNNQGGNIIPTKVFWRLKKGKEYKIVISTKNISKPAIMWFTDVSVLNELSNNELYPLIGLEYRVKFQKKTVTLFYVMSWFSVYFMFYILIKMVIMSKIKNTLL